MIDPTREPIHYAWGKFFRRYGPYIHTHFKQLNKDETTPPHSHEFMEIVIIVSGRILHQTIQGTTTLKKGDAILLRPGSWHAFGRAHNLISFNLCFIESALRSYVPLLADTSLLSNFLLKEPMASNNRGILNFTLNTAELTELTARLKLLAQMESDENQDLLAIEKIGLFISCIGLMARALHSQKPTNSDNSPINQSTKRTLELIESDIAHPHSLTSIAKKLHINKSYLARLFKKDTGMTVMDFLSRKRMELATVFLINTNKSISEIAYLTGWDDPNYFARRFRKFYSISPTKYREQTQRQVHHE